MKHRNKRSSFQLVRKVETGQLSLHYSQPYFRNCCQWSVFLVITNFLFLNNYYNIANSIDRCRIFQTIYINSVSYNIRLCILIVRVCTFTPQCDKGDLTFKDYMQSHCQLLTPANTEEAITSFYQCFDKAETGYITKETFAQVLEKHIQLPRKQADEIFTAADANKAGMLNMGERLAIDFFL